MSHTIKYPIDAFSLSRLAKQAYDHHHECLTGLQPPLWRPSDCSPRSAIRFRKCPMRRASSPPPPSHSLAPPQPAASAGETCEDLWVNWSVNFGPIGMEYCGYLRFERSVVGHDIIGGPARRAVVAAMRGVVGLCRFILFYFCPFA